MFVNLADEGLDGLFGPFTLVGYAFWTDNGQIAWLLSEGPKMFSPVELERALNSEVTSFCQVARVFHRWMKDRGVPTWDKESDQSDGDRLVYKGGILVGYAKGDVMMRVWPDGL